MIYFAVFVDIENDKIVIHTLLVYEQHRFELKKEIGLRKYHEQVVSNVYVH